MSRHVSQLSELSLVKGLLIALNLTTHARVREEGGAA